MNRKQILERISIPEDRILTAKFLDMIKTAGEFFHPEVSDFLDPYQQTILLPVLEHAPGISFIMTGGYPGAERKKVVICPDYLDPSEEDAMLSVLNIAGLFKFQKVSHRDFLGSILGLGIRREKIGDLLVQDDCCQAVVDREIAGYISHNLQKVHRISVTIEEKSTKELILPAEEFREISATVSSLRLDAVAAAGFGISRSKMSELISGEKVKVNWLTVKDGSAAVKQGDVISVRGKGRVEVTEIRGQTRKGRISVLLKGIK